MQAERKKKRKKDGTFIQYQHDDQRKEWNKQSVKKEKESK